MTRLFSIILNLVHLLKNQGHHTQGSINQEHDAEDSKAQLELLRTALKQIETEAKADRALKNEELRLERQRLWIERATLFFVIIGVVGAFYNLQLLKASMNVTEQQLLASRRPWVSVDIGIDGDWENGPEAATIKVNIRTKNHGLTPAVEVRISNTIFLWRPRLDAELIAEQNKICEMGQRDPHMGAMSVGVLFPGQESIQHTGFWIGKAGIDKSLEAFTHAIKNYSAISPHIIGCVSYRFTFDDTIHKTPFNAQISMRDSINSPDNSPELLLIETTMPKIPAKMLSMRRMIFQGESQPD